VRYLIVSDIHGNWEALRAVLDDAAGKYDEVLNCGDLVGYGPDPNAVVDWARKNTAAGIRGNHDKSCVGLEDLEWFNPVAKMSAMWTNKILTEENREYLRTLPAGPLAVGNFQIVHGSPVDEDEYLVTKQEAGYVASFVHTQLSFFGHTHLQGGFLLHRNGVKVLAPYAFQLEDDSKYLVNPGSVGQPRDHDPEAAYAIYTADQRLVEFGRVAYDIETTQRKIMQAGLPDMLAYRLTVGK
jgi:diadenosine tetraphosphatase ApaH/serine/threonine PP2A family protein phosphatase